METGLTRQLADYVCAVSPAGLPASVRHETTRALLNIIGCMLGGANHSGVNIALDALAAFQGPAQATLIGRAGRTDALHAALINCLSSSIYSFDDTHEQAVVHPAGPVAAAALAAAELQPVSGRDLITAVALGIELECRLCKAITVPPASGSMAWSGTGITGGFGAVVAAARILGLDAPTTCTAMGIALSQAAGFRVMHGSLCTPMMPAQGAQTGLRAAFLARAGFTASQTALEGRHGYLSVFCERPDLDALAGGLGNRFEVLRNTYKPYPCGIVIHPIIDACLNLRRTHDLQADRIARVAIDASPGTMALCNNRNPRDEMQAHVSLHHWTAVAFIRGTARIVDMDTDTAVRDAALMAFQDKVQATLNPTLASDAARVTVTMTDGATHTCHTAHATGSAARPMTDLQLEEKLSGMAEPVLGAARTKALIAGCWSVESLDDAAELARLAA